MPIYEYKCEDCGCVFEVLQRISDPPVKVCQCCNGHHVHKLISLSSFSLKGSGWYVTDYAKKSSSSSNAGKPAKKKEKKKDAKPAKSKKKSDSAAA